MTEETAENEETPEYPTREEMLLQMRHRGFEKASGQGTGEYNLAGLQIFREADKMLANEPAGMREQQERSAVREEITGQKLHRTS